MKQMELPLRRPIQMEMTACQICGRTFSVPADDRLETKWTGGIGYVCASCTLLNSLRREATSRHCSLRAVVFEFLKGTAKRERKTINQVWKEE